MKALLGPSRPSSSRRGGGGRPTKPTRLNRRLAASFGVAGCVLLAMSNLSSETRRLLCSDDPASTIPASGLGLFSHAAVFSIGRRFLTCDVYSYVADDTFPPTDNPGGSADFGTAPPGGSDNVAYVVTVTSCPEDDTQPVLLKEQDPGSESFYDAAAVLQQSVCSCSAENPDSTSKYNHTMYAIVHPDAVNCDLPASEQARRLQTGGEGGATQYNRVAMLQDLGYWVKIYEPPVALGDLPDGDLKDGVEGDAGLRDLMKLHALRLASHDFAVVLSFDAAMRDPMDAVLDAMKGDASVKGAYAASPSGEVDGAWVVKPDQAQFDAMVAAYKGAAYDQANGWGGTGIGTSAGGTGTKGFLKHWYDSSASGLEVDGSQNSWPRAFDSACGRPWQCKYDDGWDQATKDKCKAQNSDWYSNRNDFETGWNKPASIPGASGYHDDNFLGYCTADADAGGYQGIPRSAPAAPTPAAPAPTPAPTTPPNPWLVAHNTRRARVHAENGAAYAPLRWDDALAAQAQAYADWLMAQKGAGTDSATCFDNINAHGLDENAYGNEMLGARSGSSQIPTAESILTSWADGQEASVGGHFLQVVWRPSEYVGCAQASEGTCHYQVCRYVRPGLCNTYGKDAATKLALAMADSSPCTPFDPPPPLSPTPVPPPPPPTPAPPAPAPTEPHANVCAQEDATKFNICLDTLKTGTYSNGDWTQALAAGAAKWESVIVGNLQGTFNLATLNAEYNCGNAPDTVDDLYICAKDPAIDGTFGVLGSAGPKLAAWIDGKVLPFSGYMRFDSADIDYMMSTGTWDEVVKHEIGHILGVGSLWDRPDLNQDLVTGASPFYYKDPDSNACQRWRDITGCSADGPNKCPPIEEDGGAGTAGAHWDEVVMGTELMSGYVGDGTSPLSAITVGLLEDLGYTVDYGAADPYALSCPAGGRRRRLNARALGGGDAAGRRKLSDEGAAAAVQYANQVLDQAAAQHEQVEAEANAANPDADIVFLGDTFVSVYYIEEGTVYQLDVARAPQLPQVEREQPLFEEQEP